MLPCMIRELIGRMLDMLCKEKDGSNQHNVYFYFYWFWSKYNETMSGLESNNDDDGWIPTHLMADWTIDHRNSSFYILFWQGVHLAESLDDLFLSPFQIELHPEGEASRSEPGIQLLTNRIYGEERRGREEKRYLLGFFCPLLSLLRRVWWRCWIVTTQVVSVGYVECHAMYMVLYIPWIAMSITTRLMRYHDSSGLLCHTVPDKAVPFSPFLASLFKDPMLIH